MEENTENPEPENTQNEPATPPDPDTEKKAPWEESGEEFNAEKAWNLIQNLRSDRESLKKERDEAAGKVKSIEDEKLTELERTQRDLEETRAQFAELTQANALNAALADHPELSKEDFDLIKGSTPEEVADKAAKLAARYASQAQAQAKNNNPVAALNPLLRADPRGGTAPNTTKSHDWLRDALAQK
jgi:hypothetical protein